MLLDELSELVGNAMVIVGDGRGVRNRQPKPPTKQGDDRAPIREPANRRHFGEGGHKAERRMPALYGAGDLAEIAILSTGETTIKVLCVIDPQQPGRRCGGLPIVADLAGAVTCAQPRRLDGIILTDTRAPQASFDDLLSAAEIGMLPPDRIAAPSLLRISRAPVALAEETVP